MVFPLLNSPVGPLPDPLPSPIAIMITGLVLSIGCYFIGRYFTRTRKRIFLVRAAFVLMLLVSVSTAVSTTWAIKRSREREARHRDQPTLEPVRQWDESSQEPSG